MKHFRSCTNKGNSSQNSLPEELKVHGETYTDSEDIAFKLNEYFASVCDQFQTGSDPSDILNLSKLEDYDRSKIPSHVYFTVPYITIEQVSEFIHALDPTKATGLDGLEPRNLKMAANMLAPSISN